MCYQNSIYNKTSKKQRCSKRDPKSGFPQQESQNSYHTVPLWSVLNNLVMIRQFDPLKYKISPNYIHIIIPYRAVNTLPLFYKNQSVNAV